MHNGSAAPVTFAERGRAGLLPLSTRRGRPMRSHGRRSEARLPILSRAAFGISVGVLLAAAVNLARADDVDPDAECGIFEQWAGQGEEEVVYIHAAAGTTNTKPSS